ncbi:44877_t:CDS:2, partial [Gigaspora margarita]
MLQKQRNEISQSVYYEAIKLLDNDIKRICNNNQEIEIRDASKVNIQQILLKKLIYLVGELNNIIEIWSVNVGNSITTKHYILLLKNQSHYFDNADVYEEPFLKADKFYDEILTEIAASLIPYLCAFKFTENDDESFENLSEDEFNSDKKNEEFVLKNSKKRHGK